MAEACGPDVYRNSIVFPYFMDVPATSDGTDRRRHVVFLGGFGHPPNIDAALHLKQEIWPLLRDALPESAKLLIVGAGPPEEVIALADGRVEVTGFVPDLLPVFERARVCVAPIRYGAGIKGKWYQGCACGPGEECRRAFRDDLESAWPVCSPGSPQVFDNVGARLVCL